MTLNFAIDTSRFDPFKWYSAAVQTMKDYGTTYSKYLDMLNKIAEEKGLYILPEGKYKDIMDKYNEDFDEVASDFSRGMNINNAAKLRLLRTRYASEITPIRTMVLNYNKDLEKVSEIRRTNPSAIVLMGKLEDYYGGIGNKYHYASGNLIVSEVSAGTKALLSSVKSNYKFNTTAAEGYLEQVESGLLGVNDLYNIVNNPITNIEVKRDLYPVVQRLSQFYNECRNKYSFEGMDKEFSDAINYSINIGAAAGAQGTKSTIIPDKGFSKDKVDKNTYASKQAFLSAMTRTLTLKGYFYNAEAKKWTRPRLVKEVTDEFGKKSIVEDEVSITDKLLDDMWERIKDDSGSSNVHNNNLLKPQVQSGSSVTPNDTITTRVTPTTTTTTLKADTTATLTVEEPEFGH